MNSRLTRRVAAGLGVAAFISMGALTACGGSEEKPAPSSTTESSTSAPSVTPTEKSLRPSGGNAISPPVKAPPAPTGRPGTNHTG